MNLYLLRHAEAVQRKPERRQPDRERCLTNVGKERMRRIAQGIGALELTFDFILSSPYVRAWQTAEILARARRATGQLKRCDSLAPGAKPETLIRELQQLGPTAGHVVIVGHEPSLSLIAGLLIAGRHVSILKMRKGGLCKLGLEQLRFGRCATLEWLLTPRQLEGLAGS